MANILMIEGRREAYGAEDLLHKTFTVGELIAYLEQFDEDTKVVLNNDNGYTFGSIDWESFEEKDPEEEGEE